MGRHREEEPSGCIMVISALILLGCIYAVVAYVWEEHQTAVLAIAGGTALIAGLLWLLDAPRRSAAAAEAQRIAALTPAERDALREQREREEDHALERQRQRRLSAERAAEQAVREMMRAKGFGEAGLYETRRVDEFGAGCEIVLHARGEHGGLLEGTAYVWDDDRPVDVSLRYAEPL